MSTKVLRVGIQAEVHNLDPLKAQDVDSMLVLRQTVESPFSIKAGTSNSQSALFAEGLHRVQDSSPQIYRARLKRDLKLSNGDLLSPQDVADSLSRVTLVHEQTHVMTEGEDIVFTLKRPNAHLDLVLSHPQCAVHRMEGSEPLGTGPFRISPESTPGRIRLVRNPHYRRETALDEIIFTAYPPDEDGKPRALIRAIQEGEVDFSNALARDDAGELSGVRKSLQAGVSTALLYMNQERPQLRDVRVRQALARSIDRIEVAKVSYNNALAFAAPSLLPRALGAAEDDLAYDLPAARELLAQSGVQAPDCLSVLMTWAPRPYLPHPDRFLEILSSQVGKLGVRLEPVVPKDSLEFLERIIAGSEDMTLMGWVADTMDAADFLEANLASNRVPTHQNIAVSHNNGRLQSQAMDRALDQFRADHTSGSLGEIMRLLSEEAPLVPLAYGPATAVMSFQVQGFSPTPLSIFSLAELDLS